MDAIDELEVAVRAWAVPDYLRHVTPVRRSYSDIGPSDWTLVFDTETTTDRSQRLRFGTYQLRYRGQLRRAGVLFEPGVLSNGELATLRGHAASRGWQVKTRAEFVDRVFLPTAWTRRGLVIGHNLPFDISRIAIGHSSAQSRDRSMRGAFSFRLSADPNASHVQIKRTNPGAAFIRLTIPGGKNPEHRNREGGGRAADHHGYFVDTATLAAALLGGRPKLGKLAEDLETEHRKLDPGSHSGELTPAYLDYAMQDAQVTWECWEKLRDRYATYQLPTEPWGIYSEASIGKAHLKKMGLRPAQRFDDWLMAVIMETYYGGRADCSIRRVAVPGVYVDFASQYPTVFVLMGLWRFMTAERITWREEHPDVAQALLDEVTVDDVLGPELWPQLTALVLVEPDGDRLPTRARYQRRSRGDQAATTRSLNVGVSRRSGGPRQWWTLADCIASKQHTGRTLKVVRSIRFIVEGQQGSLKPIDVAGKPDYRIDPRKDASSSGSSSCGRQSGTSRRLPREPATRPKLTGSKRSSSG